MVKLAALAVAGVVLAVIVGALIVFPLLQVGGFKVFRRRY